MRRVRAARHMLQPPEPEWRHTSRPMNASERRLFALLKDLDLRVVPQARVGPWTVDFLFPELRIVVEADSRLYHTVSEDAREDRLRDEDLRARGFRVVHVWSDDLYRRGGWHKVRNHVRLRVRRLRGVWLGGRPMSKYTSRFESLASAPRLTPPSG